MVYSSSDLEIVSYQQVTYERAIYTVWEKSKESDFILTINFIIFTNHGYPP